MTHGSSDAEMKLYFSRKNSDRDEPNCKSSWKFTSLEFQTYLAQLQVAKTICLLEPKVSHPTNNENKLGESRQDVTKARNDFLPMLIIISSDHGF